MGHDLEKWLQIRSFQNSAQKLIIFSDKKCLLKFTQKYPSLLKGGNGALNDLTERGIRVIIREDFCLDLTS